MLALLKLIRPLNLLIMALTMYAMRYFIIEPMLRVYHLELVMPDLDFALLALSVVFLGAAGYIINDYFDIRADRINRDGKVIVGKLVKRRVAMAAHMTLNILGVGIGIYLSWKVGLWKLSFIHIFAAGSLWYYSTMFKRELFIGNFIVSIITGVVPLVPAIFEMPLFVDEYGVLLTKAFSALMNEYSPTDYFNTFFYWTGAFALFAFLLSMIREIQKDMADVEGDEAVGSTTIPIQWGYKAGKGISIALSLIVMLLCVFIMEEYLVIGAEQDLRVRGYIILFILVPLFINAILTYRAKTRRGFLIVSNITKVIMVIGIGFSLICRELLYLLSTI